MQQAGRILPVLAIVALLAGLGVLAALLLGGGDDVPPTVKNGGDTQADRRDPDEPEITRPGPMVHVMAGGYPWGDFKKILDELKRPYRRPDLDPLYSRKGHTDAKLRFHPITLRMTDVTMREIIEEMGRQTKDTGVKVYTREPYFDDAMKRDIHLSDQSVWQIYEYLREETGGRLNYGLNPDEVCIGTWQAVGKAEEEALQREARLQFEPEREAPLLDATFRPDFDAADAEKVALAMRAQTGTDVVLDALIWEKHLAITWRAGEMTLRKALDHLTKKLGAIYRVKDDRVYVIPVR